MKYLKLFEDIDNSLKNELEEFCDTYLAYLKDKGFYINLVLIKLDKHILITIEHKTNVYFDWLAIEDEFIPFYELLKSKYELVSMGEDSYILFQRWNKLQPATDFMLYNYEKTTHFFQGRSTFYKDIASIKIEIKERI